VHAAQEATTYANPGSLSGKALAFYEDLARLGSKEAHDLEVGSCRSLIDEVLAIASPRDAFGVVKVQYPGRFDDAHEDFFNPQLLRELFQRVSQQHFDYATRKPTGKLDELMTFWERLRSGYNAFAEKEALHLELMLPP
jgi:hypothetical protein